jgi:hypothetical protein
MSWLDTVFLSVHGLGVLFVVGALVYLVVRRVRVKKEETFEKRDS